MKKATMNAKLLSLVLGVVVAASSVAADPEMVAQFMKQKQKMMHRQMEYFVASGPEDNCGTVPAETMMGKPMMEACAMVRHQDTGWIMSGYALHERFVRCLKLTTMILLPSNSLRRRRTPACACASASLWSTWP